MRVHAAKRTAENLQRAQGADSAIIAALRPKVAELEQCSLDKESKVYEMRTVAEQHEQKVGGLRAFGEGRQAAMEELAERVRMYEAKVEEKRSMMAELEGEGQK